MLRFLVLVILVCGFATRVESQIVLRPQVGINFPKLTDEIRQGKFKGNAGYQFGLDVQLGGAFYVQPGLMFESANLALESAGDVLDIRVSRIDIPVVLGYHLLGNDDGSLGLRLFAGPNFAINVNEDLDESFDEINKDNIRNAQISAQAGLGLDLAIFFLDASYKFGISKFFEDINSDASINLFLVNAGLRLKL